jgi:hypothetical protein
MSGLKLGIDAGFFLRMKPVEMFAVQLELLYAMKGGKTDDDSVKYVYSIGPRIIDDTVNISIVHTTKLHYIQIPVLFKLCIPGLFADAYPTFFVGPYYAYMLNRKVDSKGSFQLYSTVDTYPVEDKEVGRDNEHDFGIVAGAGIDFGLGTLDIRYSMGFETIEADTEDDSKNGSLSVMFGFLF